MRHVILVFSVLCGGMASAHADERRTEIELNESRATLGHQYSDWNSAQVDMLHRFADDKAAYGSIRQTRRFSLDDQDVMAGTYVPLSPDWSMVVEGDASPSHKVLPRWSAFTQLQRKLCDGWDVQAGVRRTEYNDANTLLTSLTAERYWQNYRAAITAYGGHLDGAGTFPAARLQLDYYYGDDSHIGISSSGGREAENQGTTGLMVSKVRETGIVGRHWLSPSWAISYAAVVHRQGDFYTRHELQLGIRRRF